MIYRAFSEINRYNHPYQIILRIVKYQSFVINIIKSRKENPQKLTQLSPRSHPRHQVGKRTAQKNAIKDITNDSQVNSCFPYRWSPASLTINVYFDLFLYLYITRITINNGTPHLKSLGRLAIKLLGRGGGALTRGAILGALYLISINLFLILISKLVPLTLELARTLNMFIRLQAMLLRAI